MRCHAVIAKEKASTGPKQARWYDRSIPGDYLMVVGFLMIAIGFLFVHQWGWVLGGILFFLMGCGMFHVGNDWSFFFDLMDKEEGGLHEEGDGTENLVDHLSGYK